MEITENDNSVIEKANRDAEIDAKQKLEEEEKAQKDKLSNMKNEEYHWYKLKMLGSFILIPIAYTFFFLLMKA